jgi:hypothetical protein
MCLWVWILLGDVANLSFVVLPQHCKESCHVKRYLLREPDLFTLGACAFCSFSLSLSHTHTHALSPHSACKLTHTSVLARNGQTSSGTATRLRLRSSSTCSQASRPPSHLTESLTVAPRRVAIILRE